ncbi:MAG: hypothetical protein LBI14_08015 [Treponema sp.]|jgi:hypothetical protein|nr:hypothetical protein [Treponema sp.]
MTFFDASKNWTIIAPPGVAVKNAAEDLALCIGQLRDGKNAKLVDPYTDLASDVPIIVLNDDSGSPGLRGFSWRLGRERIEIYGQGVGGLCKGIYDFLSSLGINWKDTPTPDHDKVYTLKNAGANQWQNSDKDENIPASAEWKRLVIPESTPVLRSSKKRADLFRWAIRNCFDAIVFPFNAPTEAMEEAKSYGLEAEAGGWALSFLVPRKLFFFHKDVFRMEGGKRRKNIHFCPTNHETIAVIQNEIKNLPLIRKTDVLHLWPEKGNENIWCACPACRAFTIAEQYRIAVNAAADALAEINPNAFISIYETTDEEGDIPLRPNVFKINPEKIGVRD